MITENREAKIIKASWVAIIGNALLSILKILIGIFAGSFGVIADGIDSASDVLTSFITLVTAHIISKPPDPKYPYGYSKADTIATKVLAFIIFFAGAQLAISSFNRLTSGEVREIPQMIAIYIIIVSIVGKYLLSFYLMRTGKNIDSKMLIANGRNMQNDVIISLSVMAGLIFTYVLEMPILDLITAMAVSIYIMIVAFRIFLDNNRDLMDGVDNQEIYSKIISACNSTRGVTNPHRIRVRKMANLYLVALDIEIDGNKSLNEAHEITHIVEKKIKKEIPNIYDILVHPEPTGTKHHDEKYGVSEKELNK